MTPALLVLVFAVMTATAGAQQPPAPPPVPEAQTSPQKPPPQEDHSAHQPPRPAEDHSMHGASPVPPPTGLPPITDADRAAAFPDVHSQHTVHDEAIHSFVLFDRLEWQAGDGASGFTWENNGWIGGDINRVWFSTEGETHRGEVESAELQLLYGRMVRPWWDLVAGVRQDLRPGPARTWAVIGVQGLAPYWFEVSATAAVGASGRTHFRFETEYELLLTNRLIVQPLIEMDLFGKSDPERGLGAGLSSMEAGLRLRYEVRREFAPYVGVTWERKFFGTRDAAEAAGEDPAGARFAAGLRIWF